MIVPEHSTCSCFDVDLLLFIVEQVIKTSDKQYSEELKRIGRNGVDGVLIVSITAVQERRKKEMDVWTETVKLRLS
jgi:hypothetical protein